jgi:hypothetical protein
MMSAYLHYVFSPVWCPPTCMLSVYLSDVCLLVLCLPTLVLFLLNTIMSAWLYDVCIFLLYLATCSYDVLLPVWYDVFLSVCHPTCIMSACENVAFLTSSSENLAFLTVLRKFCLCCEFHEYYNFRETRKSRKFDHAELSRKFWNEFRRKP